MPSKRQRRNASVDGDARELILDAAEKLIAATGFDATSTAAVAGEAGVPKGLVFYYFPTKDAILKALMSERLTSEPIRDVSAIVAPGDPARSLVNLDAALNLGDHHSSVLRVILWREAETHPDVRTQLRKLRTHLIDTTVRVLAASAPNTVAPKALRATASAWVSSMLSFASTNRLGALDGLPHISAEELRDIARLVTAGMVSATD